MDGENAKVFWSPNEVEVLLELIENNNIIKEIDKKTMRHSVLFGKIAEEMRERGISKTWQQVTLKFKILKQQFNKELTRTRKSGEGASKFKYFGKFKTILAHRPRTNPKYGVDVLEALEPQNQTQAEGTPPAIDEPVAGSGTDCADIEELLDTIITSASPGSASTTSGNSRGKRTYESALKNFANEIRKAQMETQEDFCRKQRELVDRQREIDLELQSREDRRMEKFLQSLSTIFQGSEDLVEYDP